MTPTSNLPLVSVVSFVNSINVNTMILASAAHCCRQNYEESTGTGSPPAGRGFFDLASGSRVGDVSQPMVALLSPRRYDFAVPQGSASGPILRLM
ncbi:hypothetical protein Zmor_024046 [Zophobas morio]|uniref:Uncharacterized protein n=1 Tax=Zophobas morio TaxID=2755281 RepID=A0AA38HZM6_9CUCU|nr:hypothetical protein Zmor_024046 [Zophobas morio]